MNLKRIDRLHQVVKDLETQVREIRQRLDDEG